MSEYENILKEVTAQLGYADCSMIEFAQSIKTCIKSETEKINPDNALIVTLIRAGCIGWELIQKSKAHDIE